MKDFLEELWFVAGGKKILWWVAAVLIAIFLICMGGKFCVGKRAEHRAIESAKGPVPYAKESIDAITAAWDPQELTSRASQTLKESPGKIDEVMTVGKTKLGKVVRMLPLKLVKMQVDKDPEIGPTAMATVFGTAMFEKGTADIQLDIHKVRGQWSIDSFTLSVYAKEEGK